MSMSTTELPDDNETGPGTCPPDTGDCPPDDDDPCPCDCDPCPPDED